MGRLCEALRGIFDNTLLIAHQESIRKKPKSDELAAVSGISEHMVSSRYETARELTAALGDELSARISSLEEGVSPRRSYALARKNLKSGPLYLRTRGNKTQ